MSNEEEILKLLREGKEERKQMHEKINDLEKAVHNSSIRNQRIETKLVGDKEYSTPGLIDDVESLKKFQKKTENKTAKEKGIVIGLAAASGGLVAYLKSLFGS